MSSDEPYVRLPERIEFTLAARDAAEMITGKLWPELGDLLEDDDEA